MKNMYIFSAIFLCLLCCTSTVNAQCDNAPAAQLTVGGSCVTVAFNRTVNADYWDEALFNGSCEEDNYYDAYTWFDALSNSTTIRYTSASDAILTLFSSACSASMVPVTCTNNFGAGGTESITYSTTPGQRYHIRIQNYYSNAAMTGTVCVFDTRLATLTTTPVGAFSSNSATLGGNISAQGTSTVTERGIVYATVSRPTVADTKVTMGSGTGTYSASVTGLAPNTVYYVRAYAINTTGTVYAPEQTFTTSGTLPLNILSFSGTPVQGGTMLQWTTNTENELAGFQLQRSADGSSFIAVADIPATNTSVQQLYTYTDNTATGGTVYYRLKETALTGRYLYSAVIAFRAGQKDGALTVYPNPFSANPTLTVRMAQADAPLFKITDNTGRTVKYWQQPTAAGSTAVSIPMDGLAPGIYYLQIKGKAISKNVKLVKN